MKILKKMKKFNEVRKGKMPPGEHVSDMKFEGVPIMVHKQGSKFVAYVDGDKLDTYTSQKEAEKMAKEFVKQYKG